MKHGLPRGRTLQTSFIATSFDVRRIDDVRLAFIYRIDFGSTQKSDKKQFFYRHRP